MNTMNEGATMRSWDGVGLRKRKGQDVMVSLPEDNGSHESDAATTPSSDSTQLASERMGCDDWTSDLSETQSTQTTTMTFQVTGDPAEILKAIKQAGLADLVVLQSQAGDHDTRNHQCSNRMAEQDVSQPESVSNGATSEDRTNDHEERSYFKTSLQELIWSRSTVLIVLLVLQSASSVVLSSYQQLIERNVFLALFLTMLTGTGGNAGNQSCALVIRGLGTGEINRSNMLTVLLREVAASSVIGLALAAAAFSRVVITDGCDMTAAAIISSSTYITVVGAIAGGTAVPMVLERLGLDPCNLSSPILATITDVMGVLLLCVVTTALVGAV